MRIVLCLLLFPMAVFGQNRVFNNTITQTSEATITKEANYTESFGVDRFGKDICIVSFDAQIDGSWHKAQEEHTLDNKNEGCKKAAMLARKKLTSSIKPFTITSKVEIQYEENSHTKHIYGYKKGEIADIGNLQEHPKYLKSFSYQGTECKRFYDVRKEEKGIKQYNLIACKLSAGWVVEDTF